LEVVEIGKDAGGNIVLGMKDRIVECAVKMLKIPQEGMLKTLLHQGRFPMGVGKSIRRRKKPLMQLPKFRIVYTLFSILL
jgi:aminoglycoside phosphotransferase family enzyme